MSLDPSRFSLNEYVNSDWTLTVETGTTLEDVLKPDFLSNVAAKLHPYDRVRVRIDTGEWYAELLVLQSGRVWAKCKPLFVVELVAADEEEREVDSQYVVKFNGPHQKWIVIRKSDNEKIKELCANKSEANAWLSSYLLTL